MAIDPDLEYRFHLAVVATGNSKHLPQLIHLAILITELGHHVSFVSNLPGIKAIRIDPSNPNSSKLDLIPLQEDNVSSLKESLNMFLELAVPCVDWVLFDISTFWVPEISENLGIHSAFISFASASTSAFLLSAIFGADKPNINDLIPQNLGALKAYHSDEAESVLEQLSTCDAQNFPLYWRIKKAITRCTMVALSSYHELEETQAKALTKMYQTYFGCIGHLPQITANEVSSSYENNSAMVQEWLDKKDPLSVVYVVFENEIPITDDQVSEIANGLESSRLPFIWVIGSRQGDPLHKLPSGFCGRTINYGLVCRDWVPHDKILSHPSVGGFLTNGNWNSWIEALDSGIPLILAPSSTDEVPNAAVIEARNLGCEVERDHSGVFRGDHVAQALKFVMVDQGGEEIREQARAMEGVFGSLQYPTLIDFLDGLNEIKKNRKLCHFDQCVICPKKE